MQGARSRARLLFRRDSVCTAAGDAAGSGNKWHRNTLCLQGSRQRVAPSSRNTDGVLSPNGDETRRHGGHGHDIREPLFVAPCNPVAGVHLVGENLQLLDQNGACRLSRRKASPTRTLSYLSLPGPCTRGLLSVSAIPSSVITAFFGLGCQRNCLVVGGQTEQINWDDPFRIRFRQALAPHDIIFLTPQ
jgi:hypothetical protein